MIELSKIQAALHAPKGRKTNMGNGRSGYSYRSLEDILQAVKPHLDANKCSIVFTDTMQELAGQVYMKSTATLYNNDGEYVSSDGWAKEPQQMMSMSTPQISGAVSSYARKYAACGLLAIDNSEDDNVEVERQMRERKSAAALLAGTANAQAVEQTPQEQAIALLRSAKDNDELTKFAESLGKLVKDDAVRNVGMEMRQKFNRMKN